MSKLAQNKSDKSSNERRELILKIGRKIKKLRKEKHLSQEKLAKKAKIDRSHLIKIESGRASSSAYHLWKIAKVLGAELSRLLEE
jgi:transcriptional regulator with XRE-family HTH domain